MNRALRVGLLVLFCVSCSHFAWAKLAYGPSRQCPESIVEVRDADGKLVGPSNVLQWRPRDECPRSKYIVIRLKKPEKSGPRFAIAFASGDESLSQKARQMIKGAAAFYRQTNSHLDPATCPTIVLSDQPGDPVERPLSLILRRANAIKSALVTDESIPAPSIIVTSSEPPLHPDLLAAPDVPHACQFTIMIEHTGKRPAAAHD